MHFIWPCSRLVRLLMPPIEAICWEFLGREAAILFHHCIRAIVLGRKSTLSIQSPCVSKTGLLFLLLPTSFPSQSVEHLKVPVTSLFAGNNVNGAAAMLLLPLKYSSLIQSPANRRKFNLHRIA